MTTAHEYIEFIAFAMMTIPTGIVISYADFLLNRRVEEQMNWIDILTIVSMAAIIIFILMQGTFSAMSIITTGA